MKTIKMTMFLILILIAGLLAACGQASATEETTVDPTDPPAALNATLDATAVQEAVAATVLAELTQIAIDNPSPTTPPDPTNTPEPTEVPSETPTATATVDELALPNHALFVTDVTIPDGSILVAGEAFTKTWRLQNIGINTWTTEYSVVFVNGDLMEGFPINLPEEVPSGAIVDITIAMIAPPEAGTYTGFWMLSDEDDVIFGIGEFANQAFLVTIEVIEPTPVPTETPTAAPTATPES